MDVLPTEILRGIFSYLDRADLAQAGLVSRRMLSCVTEERMGYPFYMQVTEKSIEFWMTRFLRKDTLLAKGARSLHLSARLYASTYAVMLDVPTSSIAHDSISSSPYSSLYFRLPASLQHLHLESRGDCEMDPIIHRILTQLSVECPQLSALTLEFVQPPLFPTHSYSLNRLAHLRELTLSNTGNFSLGSFNLSRLPPSLTHLTTHGELHASLPDLTEGIALLPNLIHLHIEGCPRAGTASLLRGIAQTGGKHLRSLHITEVLKKEEDQAIFVQGVSGSVGMELADALASLAHLHRALPLESLTLAGVEGWDSYLHFPLLNEAFSATLSTMHLSGMERCILPGDMSWSSLSSLTIRDVTTIGFDIPCPGSNFPLLEDLTIGDIHAALGFFYGEDTFSNLKNVFLWCNIPEQVVGAVIQHHVAKVSCRFLNESSIEGVFTALMDHQIDSLYVDDWCGEAVSREWFDRPERSPHPNIRSYVRLPPYQGV